MSKPLKAALLSALVFPGAGHFFLKKHLVGTALVVVSFASLYVLIDKTVERALQITEMIQNGEVQLDVAAINELVLRAPVGSEAQVLNFASMALLIAWLVGIVDSYRVGRSQGKQKEGPDQPPGGMTSGTRST